MINLIRLALKKELMIILINFCFSENIAILGFSEKFNSASLELIWNLWVTLIKRKTGSDNLISNFWCKKKAFSPCWRRLTNKKNRYYHHNVSGDLKVKGMITLLNAKSNRFLINVSSKQFVRRLKDVVLW